MYNVLSSILLGWRFYRFRQNLLDLLHPAYFLFSDIKHILFYIITKTETYKRVKRNSWRFLTFVQIEFSANYRRSVAPL